MTSVHRIEALPGDGRWAVVFRRPDAGEQTAVVQVSPDAEQADATTVAVAAASLPEGWSIGSDGFRAITEALLALERARSLVAPGATLRDVDGGWDVMMGNVVLEAGSPVCTADGPLVAATEGPVDGVQEYGCPVCGARALLPGRAG